MVTRFMPEGMCLVCFLDRGDLVALEWDDWDEEDYCPECDIHGGTWKNSRVPKDPAINRS